LASGNTSFWNQFGDDKNIQTLIQTCRVWKWPMKLWPKIIF
jgi:hypothetical protein